MLGKLSRSPLAKNVHLCIDNTPLNELLKALLHEWGYRLTENPAEDPLLLISEGLEPPSDLNHVLTLSSSHYQGRHRLEVPLTVENLYLALENHFHRTPRNHIRICADWPILIKVRGLEINTRTVTVADRGIRFISPFEFAHAEEMEIHIDREDEQYQLHARAVYSVLGREIGRGDKIEVGAVCTPQSKEVRNSIRSRIIGTYLKRIQPVLGSNLFAEALRQLNLSRMSESIATSEHLD